MLGHGGMLVEIQPEIPKARLVHEHFVASGNRRADRFVLSGSVPFGCGGDGSRKGCETDQNGLVAEMLATKLPDIELAMATHLSRECISYMGIVGPDDHA